MKAVYIVEPPDLAAAYAAVRILGLSVTSAGIAEGGWIRLSLWSPGNPGPLRPGEEDLLALYGKVLED